MRSFATLLSIAALSFATLGQVKKPEPPPVKIPFAESRQVVVVTTKDWTATQGVAHLYDPWHPAVLSLIASTIDRARARGKAVSVCGEMAGDAVFTRLLLAMGLRSFSMHPRQIAPVKQAILRADSARLAKGLLGVLHADDPQSAAREFFGDAA